MAKWSFNMLLFSRLSEVLDISGAEIARRCGLTQQVLNRYMNSDIVLSVQVLMKICNSLRMPAHFFVSEDNNHIIPTRESATLPLDCWHPITWDTQTVELTFGDGEGRIYWKDVAKVMNVSSQKPHERFLLRKRFPIDGFMLACSHYDISPFKFLNDPNRTIKRKKTVPVGSPASEADLRADVAALNRKIDALNNTVADLTDKYRTLLDRHNRMEVQFKQYFGIGTSIGMAAEPETDET